MNVKTLKTFKGASSKSFLLLGGVFLLLLTSTLIFSSCNGEKEEATLNPETDIMATEEASGGGESKNQEEMKRRGIEGDDSKEQDSTKASEEKIDTSNWKTYRNEELGFEFKYPGEWEVEIVESANDFLRVNFESRDYKDDSKLNKNGQMSYALKRGVQVSLEASRFDENSIFDEGFEAMKVWSKERALNGLGEADFELSENEGVVAGEKGFYKFIKLKEDNSVIRTVDILHQNLWVNFSAVYKEGDDNSRDKYEEILDSLVF